MGVWVVVVVQWWGPYLFIFFCFFYPLPYQSLSPAGQSHSLCLCPLQGQAELRDV